MIKVLFTLVPCAQAEWEGDVYLNFVLNLFCQQKDPSFKERYCLTQDGDSADLIIVLEPVSFKTKNYAAVLSSMRMINRYPARVFTINQDDAPLAYLPGIYAAMPVGRFEQGLTIAGGYMVNSPNRFVGPGSLEHEPEYLLSFRGALSSPVRKRISRNWAAIYPGRKDARFTPIDAWYNHTEEQKRDYAREILSTKFVLCPRGQGSVSHRLFEVMQSARVPVIIADDWVEPIGPRWTKFSLRVAESEVRSIPKLLSEHEPAFPEMAKRARMAWEQFFSEEVRLAWMLSQLELLCATRLGTALDYRPRWNRRMFLRGNLGTLWSRIGKRLDLT